MFQKYKKLGNKIKNVFQLSNNAQAVISNKIPL